MDRGIGRTARRRFRPGSGSGREARRRFITGDRYRPWDRVVVLCSQHAARNKESRIFNSGKNPWWWGTSTFSRFSRVFVRREASKEVGTNEPKLAQIQQLSRPLQHLLKCQGQNHTGRVPTRTSPGPESRSQPHSSSQVERTAWKARDSQSP